MSRIANVDGEVNDKPISLTFGHPDQWDGVFEGIVQAIPECAGYCDLRAVSQQAAAVRIE